jgi:hypothetical protein
MRAEIDGDVIEPAAREGGDLMYLAFDGPELFRMDLPTLAFPPVTE